MRYGSVCSGVEAASVAWHPLGWSPQWFAEKDAFPSAVLAHRFPTVPNIGDMTKVVGHELAADIDLLVGGTPCQSFSIAGLRKGLDDERGNLALEFCRIAAAKRPRWIVWENVPGVLSSDGGRAFGSIIGALADLGYRLAWRVLDAQWFGVAQRRRRVFLVGYLGGSGNRAAEVLFEREGVPGNPPTRREARAEAAGGLAVGARGGIGTVATYAVPDVAQCLTTGTGRRYDAETETETLPVAAFHARQDSFSEGPVTPPLDTDGHTVGIRSGLTVRRLTPVECERLQGFPDGWTAIPFRNKPVATDGHRYKAMGNSMAVPVMRWIGERIQAIESTTVL